MDAKLLGICGFFFCVSCGATLPVDPTPPWSESNRYGMLLENDCNTVKKSIGLSGCAFPRGQINSNLFLPVLWTGNVVLTAQNCKNMTLPTDNSTRNIIQLVDLYTNPSGQSCGFEIVRTITDGDFQADKTMLGRFFIKIMPPGEYSKKMQFTIGKDSFQGVGWYQKKSDALGLLPIATQINIYPSGTKGTFRASCDGTPLAEIQYTTRPFVFSFERDESCDLEMSARSSDANEIDYGTLLWEVSTRTIDLTPPAVAIKKGKITFSFNDKDASGKEPVVFGLWVDNIPCKKTNKCTVTNNKNSYFVQGFTLSARPFYGTYSIATKSWSTL